MGRATDANARAEELLQGLSNSCKSDIEKAFDRIESDYDIRCLLTYLRRAGPTSKALVLSLFDEIALFYTDSEDALLRQFALIAERNMRANDLKTQLLKAHNGDLTGVELMSADNSQFAIFLPDASDPGRVRVQFFDHRGFFGHSTRDNFPEVLGEALSSGMKTVTKGQLERLAITPEFIAGNAAASRIADLNAGKITWAEFVSAA
jgi:hypothetical protein